MGGESTDGRKIILCQSLVLEEICLSTLKNHVRTFLLIVGDDRRYAPIFSTLSLSLLSLSLSLTSLSLLPLSLSLAPISLSLLSSPPLSL